MTTLKQSHDALLAAITGLFYDVIEHPPEGNCSCHISPPCNDCVDYSHVRELIADARHSIQAAEALNAQPDVCEWVQDKENDNLPHTYYDATCGGYIETSSQIAKEMKFCSCCGKKIKVLP